MIDLEPLKKRIEMDAPGLWRWFSAADVRALIDEVERLTDDLAVNAKLLARQCDLAREAETEVKRLRAALAEVKAEAGAVCPDFELCDHAACRASYAAWHIADVALKG